MEGFIAESPGLRNVSPESMCNDQDPGGARQGLFFIMQVVELVVLELTPLGTKASKKQLVLADSSCWSMRARRAVPGKW
jgi:hypothetical protein